MKLVKNRVTSRKLAANRANSRKSTGPRTALGKRRAARNSGKYFIFGQVMPSQMVELGEDPEEFERLRQSLRSAISPRDGFEALLAEEMAVNRWRLGRLRRAEMGTLMCERLQLIAKEYAVHRGASITDITGLGFRGLTGAQSSPQKFSQILELLETLCAKVENEGFSEQGLELLETIYGTVPGIKGAGLIARFKAEMSDDERDDEEGEDDEEEGDQDDEEEAQPDAALSGEGTHDENAEAAEVEPASEGGEEGEEAVDEPPRRLSKAARRAEARQSFLASLHREAESFARLGITDAIIRKTPMPQAAEDACLIPFKDNMEQMLRYEIMLQHEFELLQKQLREWRESASEARPGRPRQLGR